MDTSNIIISEQTIAILRQMFRPPQDRQKPKNETEKEKQK